MPTPTHHTRKHVCVCCAGMCKHLHRIIGVYRGVIDHWVTSHSLTIQPIYHFFLCVMWETFVTNLWFFFLSLSTNVTTIIRLYLKFINHVQFSIWTIIRSYHSCWLFCGDNTLADNIFWGKDEWVPTYLTNYNVKSTGGRSFRWPPTT